MSAAAKRVAISLAGSERDALQQLAHEAGEPIATTAGRLVRAALADHGAQLDAPPARRTGPLGTRRRPAPVMPASVDALRARYPHELRRLPDDLEGDALLAEQAAALATWRARLDAAGADAEPRETLAFTYELDRFADRLQNYSRRFR